MALVANAGRLGNGRRLDDARRGAVATAARPSLWRAEDLLRWAVMVAVGGIVVVVAWYVCAGEVTFSKQIGPLDVAVAGLLLAGAGNAGWLLKGRRAVGERRRALLPDLLVARQGAVSSTLDPAGAVALEPAWDTSPVHLVAGEGMERFHRRDCALARGRLDWATMSREDHEHAGRRPCGICRP